jgi:hypothetical protein
MPMLEGPNPKLAESYLSLIDHAVKIQGYLGGGTDGDVWKTSDATAVKVFKYDFGFFNERDSYERLARFGFVESIDGFWIPKMLGSNEELMVVEMDLMQHPPYILDFAKVRIDRPPDFSDDVIQFHNEQGRERFEHNWPAVQSLMSTLVLQR